MRRQFREERREVVAHSDAFQRTTLTALPEMPVMLAKAVHQYTRQHTLEAARQSRAAHRQRIAHAEASLVGFKHPTETPNAF